MSRALSGLNIFVMDTNLKYSTYSISLIMVANYYHDLMQCRLLSPDPSVCTIDSSHVQSDRQSPFNSLAPYHLNLSA